VLDMLCPPGWTRNGLSTDRLDWQHGQSVDADPPVTAAPTADKDGKLPDAAAESSPTTYFDPETLV